MTCIVGIAHNGRTWIGGDSAGVDEQWTVATRADEKVWSVGDWAFGFAVSFRVGQTLRYRFTPPSRRIGQSLEEYMAVEWVDTLRQCLKDAGTGSEGEVLFIAGHAGRLFTVYSDFQVGETFNGYAAIGSGAHVALGALYAKPSGRPRDRIVTALEAATEHTAGVRGPFRVVSTK